MAATILIVDDEPDIRELIGEILADEGFETVLAANAEEARRLRDERDPDLVLLDVWMPDSDGISVLKGWAESDRPLCPVVMISGHGSVEAAVEATRHGARDFIEKPVSMARLISTVRKALTEGREASLRGVGGRADDRIPAPVGRSEAMSRLRQRLEAVCAGRSNVLVVGEPGTGRTTLARWIHRQSTDPATPRVETGCGPGGDLESRLEALQSTDAPPAVTLIVERLEAVTEAQAARLADALDRGRPAMRVIATGASSLPGLAAAERFDAALYHRVAGCVLELPPLRERRDDIPDLVRDLAERMPAEEGLPYRPIPVPTQNRLRQHEWPGNLRELANAVREMLQAGGESPVDPDEVDALLARSAGALDETGYSPLFELPLREAREAFERQYLIERLKRADGSVGQLAEAVEMERTHLYRKLRQLGIDPKQVQEERS